MTRDRVLAVTLSMTLALMLVLLAFRVGPRGSGPTLHPLPVPDWHRLGEAGNRIGRQEASVTIIVFTDYECAYCRRFESALEALRRTFPDDVAVVYRHYPLMTIHPFAYQAARTVECAARQDRFEAMHALMFDAVSSGAIRAESLADAAAIPDRARFRQCVDDDRPVGAIEADLSEARALGTRTTPTIVMQGMLLPQMPDSVTLISHVEDLLRDGRSR